MKSSLRIILLAFLGALTLGISSCVYPAYDGYYSYAGYGRPGVVVEADYYSRPRYYYSSPNYYRSPYYGASYGSYYSPRAYYGSRPYYGSRAYYGSRNYGSRYYSHSPRYAYYRH